MHHLQFITEIHPYSLLLITLLSLRAGLDVALPRRAITLCLFPCAVNAVLACLLSLCLTAQPSLARFQAGIDSGKNGIYVFLLKRAGLAKPHNVKAYNMQKREEIETSPT